MDQKYLAPGYLHIHLTNNYYVSVKYMQNSAGILETKHTGNTLWMDVPGIEAGSAQGSVYTVFTWGFDRGAFFSVLFVQVDNGLSQLWGSVWLIFS